MSKQSDAKTTQGYIARAIPATCANCQDAVAVMGPVLVYKDPKFYTTFWMVNATPTEALATYHIV